MKTAITAIENNLDSWVDKKFGRCAYFVIYDSETKIIEFIPNVNKDIEDNAGVASVNFLAERNVTKIVSKDFGIKIKPLLDSLKMQLIVINDSSKRIKDIINLLNH